MPTYEHPVHEFISRHFLAFVITMTVGALGYLGTLSGEATSTLIGAILGYVFKNGHGTYANHHPESTNQRMPKT